MNTSQPSSSASAPSCASAVTPPPPSSASPSKGQSLLKAATVMAALLLVSKALGFARDWFILTVYGASLATDAYFAAVQLPQASIVLLGGLGGPFHTATVAVLARCLTHDEQGREQASEKAKILAATFTTATGIVFALLSVATFFLAEPVMRLLLANANDSALLHASAQQLRIMSPVIFVGGLVGIFYGALNLLHVYIWPALSPTMLSLAMIVALVAFPADELGLLLAYSTLAGGVLQFVLQVPEYLHKGFRLRPTLQGLKLPEMRDMGALLFPALLGTTIGQLTTFVDLAFAAALPEGGWSAVSLSNRVLQLPIGVLQTALLVPLFPRLAKLVTEGNTQALGQQVRLGVGALWVLVVPVLVLLLFYAEPLVRLVFQHGGFNADDTALVTLAVLFQAPSMVPYFLRDTLTRVFYAFGDSRTPLLVGALAIGLKALLNSLFVERFGVGGITLSITLVTLFNMVLLALLLQRHTRTLGYRLLLLGLGKLLVAGGALAGWVLVVQRLPLSLWQEVVLVLVGGALVYGLACVVLRLEEARYALERVKARRKAKPIGP